MAATLEALEVHPDRMLANLATTGGANMAEALSLALTPRLGRAGAHAAVSRACAQAVAEGRPLIDVLEATPEVVQWVGRETLDRLLDPTQYVGAAAELIKRVLEAKEA
jgi:3-carboxy-cis,cis-muconate cycloisomerase